MTLELTDFRQAAFLSTRGHRLQRFFRNNSGELVFVFDDSAETATRSLATYPGSPEAAYDAACRDMHNLTRSRQRRGDRG